MLLGDALHRSSVDLLDDRVERLADQCLLAVRTHEHDQLLEVASQIDRRLLEPAALVHSCGRCALKHALGAGSHRHGLGNLHAEVQQRCQRLAHLLHLRIQLGNVLQREAEAEVILHLGPVLLRDDDLGSEDVQPQRAQAVDDITQSLLLGRTVLGRPAVLEPGEAFELLRDFGHDVIARRRVRLARSFARGRGASRGGMVGLKGAGPLGELGRPGAVLQLALLLLVLPRRRRGEWRRRHLADTPVQRPTGRNRVRRAAGNLGGGGQVCWWLDPLLSSHINNVVGFLLLLPPGIHYSLW
mmetsp:Transcript_18637/g.71912  ORF Transcript_18637/g.71912 Transcript_18637/m.71912 type:complete len:299 (-) Transcript_18637:896-1792(-)